MGMIGGFSTSFEKNTGKQTGLSSVVVCFQIPPVGPGAWFDWPNLDFTNCPRRASCRRPGPRLGPARFSGALAGKLLPSRGTVNHSWVRSSQFQVGGSEHAYINAPIPPNQIEKRDQKR
jgi:hypothetical protein